LPPPLIDLSTWPALVLTAGLATRLRPLSSVRAKAALPVAGEPIISRILRWLGEAGVRRVVINLHHRPETVTRIVGDGADWNMQIRYSWENPVLGSAGGPKRALPLLESERFLIVNGDTITDCNLRAIATQHVETGALATIAVVPRAVDRAVLANADGIVSGFGPGNEHFIGVQAVDASAFADIPDNVAAETVKQLYPALIGRQPGAVRVYRSSAEFLDVGTAADYLETVDVICAREHRPMDSGAGVTVHPNATVRHSILWDRVTVGENAELVDCIVADDVAIPAGARYQQCAIANDAASLIVSPFGASTPGSR
jgi:NDP-sugar pyrophosphorylase family protein